nr:piRNA biogenesis protein EXD1-like [Leptinotarsa decemlineata]
MDTEAPYKDVYNVGDYLILKLSCGDIFEGDYNSGGQNRIDLANTKQHNNPNRKLGGIYSFYRSEIESIHKLKSKVREKPPAQVKDPEEENKIKLVEEEYERLKQMCKDYVYLEKADSRYYEAVGKLSEAETIGVAALGMDDKRTAVVKLLAVCTWKHVYLFDMINFKQRYFYPELKEVFESEYTCKVIHQAGPLVDILYRNYKVFTQNIFDTQVVDLLIEKNKKKKILSNMRNLSECLTEYLNLPSSMLKNALETTCKQWIERPLSDQRRLYAAQLVSYLIVLKEQMNKILFSDVYEAISNVHNYYYDLDCYEFSRKVNSMKVTKDIDKLIPVLNNITLQNGDNTSESSGSAEENHNRVDK